MSEKTTTTVLEAVLFLNLIADRLDRWAQVSQTGGWSTHQVKANKELANECRRMASRLNGSFLASVDR